MFLLGTAVGVRNISDMLRYAGFSMIHDACELIWTCGYKEEEEEQEENIVKRFVCLLVGCLTSQQQASVSQGRICSDNLTCCHTEIEVADQTF